MPETNVTVFPCLDSKRIITAPVTDSKATTMPKENQALFMVLQNIQQIMLSSGSPRVIGWGVHHMRQ